MIVYKENNDYLHPSSTADEMAKAINARAFTKSTDIVFREGQYQPDTTDGKKLMAHELTHVVQQGGAVQRMTGFDMVPPDQQKDYRILTPIDASKDEILKMLHYTLDFAGLIPGVGIIFDSTNVILYVAEDDWKNAGFSAAAMIPIFGQGATVTKYGLKVSKKVIEKIGKTKLAKGFKKLADKFRPTQAAKGGTEKFKKRIFEKTTIETTDKLSFGTMGVTDKYGNIWIHSALKGKEYKLTLYHEKVHSLLSPKLKLLRNLRAKIGMKAYEKSHFLRYVEEALAETYAQLRVNGLKGFPEGIMFPIKGNYVKVWRVVGEGAIGTITIGGISYGVYIISSK